MLQAAMTQVLEWSSRDLEIRGLIFSSWCVNMPWDGLLQFTRRALVYKSVQFFDDAIEELFICLHLPYFIHISIGFCQISNICFSSTICLSAENPFREVLESVDSNTSTVANVDRKWHSWEWLRFGFTGFTDFTVCDVSLFHQPICWTCLTPWPISY